MVALENSRGYSLQILTRKIQRKQQIRLSVVLDEYNPSEMKGNQVQPQLPETCQPADRDVGLLILFPLPEGCSCLVRPWQESLACKRPFLTLGPVFSVLQCRAMGPVKARTLSSPWGFCLGLALCAARVRFH